MTLASENPTAATAFLKEAGISEILVFQLAELPSSVSAPLVNAGAGSTGSVAMFINAGSLFWGQLMPEDIDGGDAFDRRSRELAVEFCRELEPGFRPRILYPGFQSLPLFELLKYAGFSRRSRLGLAIHPVYGTWFAVRALFSVPDSLPSTPVAEAVDVCSMCRNQDCVAACPAGAVSSQAEFDLSSCTKYRLTPVSACGDSCRARRVCPVGGDFRYLPEHERYHAMHSLQAIRRYYHEQAIVQ